MEDTLPNAASIYRLNKDKTINAQVFEVLLFYIRLYAPENQFSEKYLFQGEQTREIEHASKSLSWALTALQSLSQWIGLKIDLEAVCELVRGNYEASGMDTMRPGLKAGVERLQNIVSQSRNFYRQGGHPPAMDWGFYAEVISHIFVLPAVIFWDLFFTSFLQKKGRIKNPVYLFLTVIFLSFAFLSHFVTGFAQMFFFAFYINYFNED